MYAASHGTYTARDVLRWHRSPVQRASRVQPPGTVCRYVDRARCSIGSPHNAGSCRYLRARDGDGAGAEGLNEHQGPGCPEAGAAGVSALRRGEALISAVTGDICRHRRPLCVAAPPQPPQPLQTPPGSPLIGAPGRQRSPPGLELAHLCQTYCISRSAASVATATSGRRAAVHGAPGSTTGSSYRGGRPADRRDGAGRFITIRRVRPTGSPRCRHAGRSYRARSVPRSTHSHVVS